MHRLPTGLLALAAALAAPAGCRGWVTDEPPIHLNPNMDLQDKLKPYRESPFFADRRAMRTPPEGTVPRGALDFAEHYFRGTVEGTPAEAFPARLTIDEGTMRLGRERYEIFCTPCHDRAGTGQGTVAARLPVKPPTFHDERRRALPAGRIFHAITAGVNPPNMPPYGYMIPEEERWAIVLYVRALQRAQAPGDERLVVVQATEDPIPAGPEPIAEMPTDATGGAPPWSLPPYPPLELVGPPRPPPPAPMVGPLTPP